MENFPNGFWGLVGERVNMLNMLNMLSISVADRCMNFKALNEITNERTRIETINLQTDRMIQPLGYTLLIIVQTKMKKKKTIATFSIGYEMRVHPKNQFTFMLRKVCCFKIRFSALFKCMDFYENANNYDGRAVARLRVSRYVHIGMHPPAWNVCISDILCVCVRFKLH